MDRIERIESPQPHERTWAVTPVRKRDPEAEREQQRRKQRQQPPPPPPIDDDEPPRLVDVQA
jgi:hypothetical protein